MIRTRKKCVLDERNSIYAIKRWKSTKKNQWKL